MPQYLTPSSGSSPCGLSGAQLVAALPSWFVKQQVDLLGSEEQLISVVGHVDLGPSGIDAFYRENPKDFQEFCMDVIAAPTELKAAVYRGDVERGASFSSIAEISLDPQLRA
jgi:hypothetical protein